MNGFQPLNPYIRWMVKADLPTVARNEEAAFGVYAWCERELLSCLRQRNCIAKVAEHDGHAIGHCIYGLFKTHLEIVNIAVHPDYQRRGVGMWFIDHLQKRLQKRKAITAMVIEDNLSAQLFFRAMQFRGDPRRDAFPGRERDGVFMEWRVGERVRIAS